MKIKYLFISFVLFACSNAHAEWFLRSSTNGWTPVQMGAGGTNTMMLNSVVFNTAGSIKFDRFGDWKESYGVGGKGGTNIAVAAGKWKIKFFTDTKRWSITPASVSSSVMSSITSSTRASSANSQHSIASAAASSTSAKVYFLRGTFNAWGITDVFTPVAGSTTNLEICRNFVKTAAINNPRFRVDPNGGWGADTFPASDVASNGWTRIEISSTSNTIVKMTGNMAENCLPSTASSSSKVSSSSKATSISSSSKVSSSNKVASISFSSTVTASSKVSSIISSSKASSVSSSLASVGDDFRARTIYFMYVDRFANGNTNNDKGNNPLTSSTLRASGNQSEWMKYWGGDIEGIISKLDYLQSMGITAIWVTPLVDNIDVAGSLMGVPTQMGGYHGYWGRDFYAVDEHLGDWALVDELSAQMKSRGMKLILDITLNHSNPNDAFEFGTLLKDGAFMTDIHGGLGVWYHNNGAITDCGDLNPQTVCGNEWSDPWKLRNKTLYDLSDFIQGTTQNSLADEYLIGAALKWMDHGVDGFRIDALKHIEPSFINRFTDAIRAKKADAYIFGEWYGAGADDATSMAFLNEGHGAQMLYFSLRNNIENAIAGDETMTALSNHIASRPIAMKSKEDIQPTFLDNHDAVRTSVYLQAKGNVGHGNGKGMLKAFADARQNMGMALIMTLPGIPTIYYGTEQNTTWFAANDKGAIGDDPYNRELMSSFSQASTAYKMISALARLRKESIAIQRGTYVQRWVSADVLVFQRQEGTDCAVVAINRGAQTTITVPNLCLANNAYTSNVGADIVNISAGSGTFNLGQNEVVVLH